MKPMDRDIVAGMLAVAREDREAAEKAANIGRRVRYAGREWTIVGVNWLGDYDVERFEDREDGRYKIGGTCVLGLAHEHPHYAVLV